MPPVGYGGLENVVATLTTELRRRGHTVVLGTVGDSELPADGLVLCNLSGRGDKDVHTIAAREGIVL